MAKTKYIFGNVGKNDAAKNASVTVGPKLEQKNTSEMIQQRKAFNFVLNRIA